ncbi:hypothetical protein J6A64_05820 [bacterium]|nr:hypothetical protein [bacterium]MBO5446234.1 hypothetical protein [bacterium]
MLTISAVKLNTYKNISFGNKQQQVNNRNSKVGVMSIDKNANARINFEKDLHETKKADMVQTNPIKALGYNIVKAYNILCTPKRRTTQTESTYIHLPYMA